MRLLYITRELDATPPIVLGPGTPAGIPYARHGTVVYFGEKGQRLAILVPDLLIRASAEKLDGGAGGRLEAVTVGAVADYA